MKIALITPRYGAEIVHGAEHACRLLAEELSDRHDVDVLTTCARDGDTWRNDYAEGADRVRGVLVRRFAASGGRDHAAFRALTRRLSTTAHSRADELDWVRRSGSCSPGLVEFLKRQHRSYDALVFFSYGAGTTVHGITLAPERSILFPCATLDPALRFWISQDTLSAAAGIGYCSAAERRLVRAHTQRLARPDEIVGVGIAAVRESQYPRLSETPTAAEPHDEEDAAESGTPPSHLAGRGVLFRRRHHLHGRFALYGGPVTTDNGTEELIEYFDAYTARDGDISDAETHGAKAALVLMGVKMMQLPAEPWLRLGGVLPERDRLAALEAADVAIAPDPDDILGERALESFAAGTPVLASARSPAAVDHVRRANAGLYYANGDEFVDALRLLMSNDRLRASLGRNGRQYVQQQFRWDAVIGRLERLVSKVRVQTSN